MGDPRRKEKLTVIKGEGKGRARKVDPPLHPADKLRKSARFKAFEVGEVQKAELPLGSNAIAYPEDLSEQFGMVGALEPPYLPDAMNEIAEASSTLPQSIAAMRTNIEGFGFHLDPVINPDNDDAAEKIKSVLIIEKGMQSGWKAEYLGQGRTSLDPTPEEIQERKLRIKAEMAIEKARIEAFFESCTVDYSFTQLRGKKRTDEETTGNGYWEIVRDQNGFPSLFFYIPSFSVRLMPLDSYPTQVVWPRKSTPISYMAQPILKSFRRFVQIHETQQRFFKQYGDPRVVSSKSGQIFNTVQDLLAHDASDRPATEILHFALNNERGAYGMPRYTGALMAVMGTTAAEEVNYLYFDNKSVPPMALLVSGAHVKPGAVKRIEDYIENSLKGRQHFHKMLIIEAEAFPTPGVHSSNVRMHLMPLTSAQQRDGLFLQYIEQNTDRVGQAFRLPRILRGDIRDFNRATGEAALRFAEHQVFQPERQIFDDVMNLQIFPAMGWKYWKFASNSPIASDPQTMSTIIQGLTVAGILTPAEAREMIEQVLNKNLQKIDSEWVNQPLTLTISQLAHPPAAGPQDTNDLGHGNDPNADPTQHTSENVEGARQPAPKTSVQMSVNQRKAWAILHKAGFQVAPSIVQQFREGDADVLPEVETIKVPAEIMMSWLEPNQAPPSTKPDRPKRGRPRKPVP